MSNEELRILKNTIEQMACDADDKGLTDFGLRLSVADAFTLCKLEPPRRWIPCSERLPDMPGDYQVCTKNEYCGDRLRRLGLAGPAELGKGGDAHCTAGMAAGVAAGVVGHGESQNVRDVPDGTEE